MALDGPRTRWLAWTVVGFIGIALVHFFIE